MREVLKRPKWIGLGVLVAILVAAFISLGFWQLERLDERRLNNAVLEARIERPAVTLREVVASGLDARELEYTRISLVGTPDPDVSVFVRSQTDRSGEAGSHHVFPVELADGGHILVNAGWVPLGEYPADVPGLDGEQEFIGFVRATQERQTLGQEEPEGVLVEIRRIDVERLRAQMPAPLLDFWVQLESPDDPSRPPEPAPLPVLDEGTHLSYAIEWFSFAAISVVGYFFLVRREVRRGAPARGAYVVDDDVETRSPAAKD
jgi:surfeit locus 1 family protein